jgi:hypothetical protein
MSWSRQACRFAVLTVLVLQAACLDTQTWTVKKVKYSHAALAKQAERDFLSPARHDQQQQKPQHS